MALTVTFGSAAAAFGAGALSAGALGLGALGLAALAGSHRGRRGRGYGGHGGGYSSHSFGGHSHGYGGHSHGYGGHSHGYRGRRDAEDKLSEKKEALPSTKKDDQDKRQQIMEDEEQILAAIRDSDEAGCGFRLVCELASNAAESGLTEDEFEILKFVEEGDARFVGGNGVLPSSPNLAPYQSAARLGQAGYSCKDLFNTCQVTASELMTAIGALL